MQFFYSLSDRYMEDALYEIESMRHFASLELDGSPGEAVTLNFQHFLKPHSCSKALFKEVDKHLE